MCECWWVVGLTLVLVRLSLRVMYEREGGKEESPWSARDVLMGTTEFSLASSQCRDAVRPVRERRPCNGEDENLA